MQSRVPPAPNDRPDPATEYGSAGTTLDAASTNQAAGTAQATDTDSGPATGSFSQQGGSR